MSHEMVCKISLKLDTKGKISHNIYIVECNYVNLFHISIPVWCY